MGFVDVQVKGLESLKILDPVKARKAIERGMKRSVLVGERQVKLETPVDTGRLRASVTNDVRQQGNDIVGVLGSNVHYAPSMEYGTGTQSDGTGGGGVHFPPAGALEEWAQRHGFGKGGGFLVARAIGSRGGLKPRRMFRKVLESRHFGNVTMTNIERELRKLFKL